MARWRASPFSSRAAAAVSARRSARRLAAKGAKVHICGRRPQVLEAAAEEISHGGAQRASHHVCDIRDADQVEAMMDADLERGAAHRPRQQRRRQFHLAHQGSEPARLSRRDLDRDGRQLSRTLAAGKRWIAGGHKGAVVSNLVTWVWTGSAFVVPSAMAKTALHAMTMSLAVEWGRYGIRLNATAPGPFPTEGAWEKLNPIPDASSSATRADTVPLGALRAACRNCRTSSSSCSPTPATI